MKNKYYTNRHYKNTDKIRIAVNQMNKDMMELSEYCDKLENAIIDIRVYVLANLITDWDIKNNGYVSGSDLPADAIKPILEIIDKVMKNNEIK